VRHEDTQTRNGVAFSRQAGLLMVCSAVLLGGVFVVFQLSAGAIQNRRTLAEATEQTEEQIERAVALTADRGAVEAEVAELQRQRPQFEAHTLRGDLKELLEGRFQQHCQRADLRFEGLEVQPVRRRGALDSVPCRVSFSGLHQQVPVLLDGFYSFEGLLFVTGLDLEVVNFIDDRITGTLTFETPRLRSPPPPDGEILRPFLPMTPAVGGRAQRLGSGPLHDAQERLTSEYRGMLDYEAARRARDHHVAEAAQIEALLLSQGPSQADVARAVPTVVRALDRTALGRGGFRVEPGGAVEFLQYD
jgi:hypothetical protein